MDKQDFPQFRDVEHLPLRVYNRAVMSFNIREDFGAESLKEYYSLFDDKERMEMMYMMLFINQKGVEAAKQFALKDLKLEEDEDESEEV